MGRKSRLGEDRRIIPSGSDPDTVRRNTSRRTTLSAIPRIGYTISPQAAETYNLSRREYQTRIAIETSAHSFSDGVPVRTFTQCQDDHASRMTALSAHYEKFPAFKPPPGRPPRTRPTESPESPGAPDATEAPE